MRKACPNNGGGRIGDRPLADTSIPLTQARALWPRAQGLDTQTPFGEGPEATARAIAHLGYVQIDTINVIERSHHHILHTRIPAYTRTDLAHAQSTDKTVFEYWTHALAYVPTEHYRYYLPAMARRRASPPAWLATVDAADYAAPLRRIRTDGPLSIRDIDDDVLVEKTHAWDSRKPSRRALQLGFFVGDLTVGKRSGMLKTYDLAARHFGWPRRPRPATDAQVAEHLLQRALRSQGAVSLDSICYGNAGIKAQVAAAIDAAVRRKRLVPVDVEGHAKIQHWAEPAALEAAPPPTAPQTHLLSPFDPLVIQRRRLSLLFGYEHRFEAYVSPAKRVLGYFALPMLVGDRIVAAIDLKADRQAKKLLVQKWTWIAPQRPDLKAAIEDALTRFERFQLA